MNISEKASYIKGLVNGMELDENKKETKVVNALLDLICDMATEVTDLSFAYDDVCDQVDAIDEDLAAIEEVVYEEGDHHCSGGCCSEEDIPDEGEMFEITCPACNKSMILSEEEVSKGEYKCLNCGEKLEFDLSDDEEGKQ